MATHILDEIFTYEGQAQAIVDDAKKSVQEQLNQARLIGEREYSEALALMRKNREQEIEKAQLESNEIIKSFEKSIMETSITAEQNLLKATDVAHTMASLILRSELGEL